jgi:hypothetical protein
VGSLFQILYQNIKAKLQKGIVEHLVCLIYPKLTTFGLENYVEMYDLPEHKVLENTLLEHKGETAEGIVEHLVCLIYPKLTTFGLENYVEMYDLSAGAV